MLPNRRAAILNGVRLEGGPTRFAGRRTRRNAAAAVSLPFQRVINRD